MNVGRPRAGGAPGAVWVGCWWWVSAVVLWARLEWGAIIHFSTALCAAHLDATGKNLDQIVAGFLREARR